MLWGAQEADHGSTIKHIAPNLQYSFNVKGIWELEDECNLLVDVMYKGNRYTTWMAGDQQTNLKDNTEGNVRPCEMEPQDTLSSTKGFQINKSRSDI